MNDSPSDHLSRARPVDFGINLDVSDEICLRSLAAHDSAALFSLVDANRAYLRRWLPWLDVTRSVDDVAKFIKGTPARDPLTGPFDSGIWLSGELCGVIGLHAVQTQNRATSIGYWLGARFQGRGIMTATCRALVDHLFREWRLHRIVVRCASDNHRSRAIPEQLGFTLEGIQRDSEWLYDRFVDLAVYSKLSTDE